MGILVSSFCDKPIMRAYKVLRFWMCIALALALYIDGNDQFRLTARPNSHYVELQTSSSGCFVHAGRLTSRILGSGSYSHLHSLEVLVKIWRISVVRTSRDAFRSEVSSVGPCRNLSIYSRASVDEDTGIARCLGLVYLSGICETCP